MSRHLTDSELYCIWHHFSGRGGGGSRRSRQAPFSLCCPVAQRPDFREKEPRLGEEPYLLAELGGVSVLRLTADLCGLPEPPCSILEVSLHTTVLTVAGVWSLPD